MMRVVAALGLVLLANGCAPAASPPAAAPSTTGAPVTSSPAQAPEPPEPKAATSEMAAAESWAEKKVGAEPVGAPSARGDLDPLAVTGDIESSAVPDVALTPPKEVRSKSRADLVRTLEVLKKDTTFDEAVAHAEKLLGKPTWVEGGKRRVWIAKEGTATCHRLVVGADGDVELEGAQTSEWRMLSALAQQNPCTGEIRRGLPGAK